MHILNIVASLSFAITEVIVTDTSIAAAAALAIDTVASDTAVVTQTKCSKGFLGTDVDILASMYAAEAALTPSPTSTLLAVSISSLATSSSTLLVHDTHHGFNEIAKGHGASQLHHWPEDVREHFQGCSAFILDYHGTGYRHVFKRALTWWLQVLCPKAVEPLSAYAAGQEQGARRPREDSCSMAIIAYTHEDC